MPVGRAPSQRDLERLERREDKNLIKFSKGTCKTFPLGKNSPVHQDMLGAGWLESSLGGKDLGVLVGTELDVSWRVLMAKKASSVLGCLSAASKRGDPSPLLLRHHRSPVSSSGLPSERGRYGHTGESSEGHRDDLGTGVPVMGGEAVRPGTRWGVLSICVWEKKQMKSESSQCL